MEVRENAGYTITDSAHIGEAEFVIGQNHSDPAMFVTWKCANGVNYYWMFSDMLDDEDIEMQKHDFITYYQGADYYGLDLKVFTRMAHEAGAVYKIGKSVIVRRSIFEEYLRRIYRKRGQKNEGGTYSGMENDKMKQGTLIVDTQTGRMDIRFGLEDYFGGLHCGTRMDAYINGEWVPARIVMADDWYLVGVCTNDIAGLTVRI